MRAKVSLHQAFEGRVRLKSMCVRAHKALVLSSPTLPEYGRRRRWRRSSSSGGGGGSSSSSSSSSSTRDAHI